jgi:hypothetical protein
MLDFALYFHMLRKIIFRCVLFDVIYFSNLLDFTLKDFL